MAGYIKVCSNSNCQKEFKDYSKHQHEKYCSMKCKSNDLDRFWAKVIKTDYCWNWQGRKTQGYGQIDISNKTIYTHRLSWEIHNGSIPDDLDVLHKCDNPSCVNPEHLFLGTHTDNMHDMFAKGRRHNAKGEKNNRAKLTECQVIEIRQKYKKGNGTQLAKEYNISISNISSIIHYQSWSWLKGDAPGLLANQVETLLLRG